MNVAINKKTIFRLVLLLFMAVATIQLTGCGSDVAPSGSTITVEKIGVPIIIGPILTNPTNTATTTKTQIYRVNVADPTGLPMNDIDVHFLGQFSNGQNINFGGAIGTATITLSTTQKTGDFGFLDFAITSPYYSIGNARGRRDQLHVLRRLQPAAHAGLRPRLEGLRELLGQQCYSALYGTAGIARGFGRVTTRASYQLYRSSIADLQSVSHAGDLALSFPRGRSTYATLQGRLQRGDHLRTNGLYAGIWTSF